MIEQVAGKLEGLADTGITPRQLDLLAGPLPEGPFDLIYSAMTLHQYAGFMCYVASPA